jgi:hypothetical protein
MAKKPETTLDTLLEFVRESRGFDFTGYQRSSIERRVAKRMRHVGAERYDEYLDYLQLHAEEFAELFNAILINVTGFFRDPQTWEYVATQVAPQLTSARGPDAPIRVWCAGCASGEEPYTAAMLLAPWAMTRSASASRSTRPMSTRRRLSSRGMAHTTPARSRTCRTMRSSASSSAPIKDTYSARTCGDA